MSMHLDRNRLRALLDGALSEEAERELVAHLAEGGCEQCEEFLGSLDDSQEQELLAILQRSMQARDLPETAQQRVLGTRPSRFFGLPPVLVPVAGLAFLALVALVTSLIFMQSSEDPGQTRIKGKAVARAPGIDLILGLVTGEDEEEKIVRLANGSKVPTTGRVILRVNTEGACYLYLLRVDAGGKLEVLLPAADARKPFFHPGGTHTPMISGYPAGAPLRDLTGVQHFVAGCSLKPLRLPEDLGPLLTSLRTGKDRSGLPAVVSFDVVTVRVSGEGQIR
jgi:hypothetical protein